MDRESMRNPWTDEQKIEDIEGEVNRARAMDAAEARAAAEKSGLKYEGPQIFTREQFGKESGKWLKKLNAAQDALMKEITNRAMYKGENVDTLDAQAAQLKSWIDRVWSLSIQNAHEGLSEPEGVMSVDRELLDAVEGNVMEAAEATIQRAAFPETLKAREGFKEIADLREHFDILQDRLNALQKGLAEQDGRIRELMEQGKFDAKTAKLLAEEREELERLHTRDMGKIQAIMPKLNRALDAYKRSS